MESSGVPAWGWVMWSLLFLKCSVPYIARWGMHSDNWPSSSSIGPRITTRRWGMLSVLELQELWHHWQTFSILLVCMACCGSHDTSVTLSFRLQLWYSIKTRIDLNPLLKLGEHHTSSVYWGEECSLHFIFSLQSLWNICNKPFKLLLTHFGIKCDTKQFYLGFFTSHRGLRQNTCEYRPGAGRDFHLLPRPADYLAVTLGPLSCTVHRTKRPLLPEQILSSQSTRYKNRIVSS